MSRLRPPQALAAALALTGAAAIAATAPPALASSTGHGPTAAQIRAAVRRAERSRDLWATVNICRRQDNKDVIGIRGQMPSLGFTTEMSITVRVEFWSRDSARFLPVPRIAKPVALGTATHTVVQGGASFRFHPPAGLLRGAVTFVWKLGDKVLAKTTRKTSHGHKHVDYADPPGYSAGTCTLG